MESKIKSLFKLKNAAKPALNHSIEPHSIEGSEERKRTYYEAGFNESKRNSGAPTTLKICLRAIHAKFQNEERSNLHRQQELKAPYKEEQSKKQSEKKGVTVAKENREQEILMEKEKVQNAKTEIENLWFKLNDLRENPEKYGIDAKKGASVKFWIGIFILIPITLYLFTFYTSASYSAFFKDFTIQSGVIESIFDSQALNKAWSEGFTLGLFVTFIPFVFLGLGYLIHMFGENKSLQNTFKVILLVVVTFVFDAILAYQIENQLYNINRTLDSPNFNLGVAFTSVQFWGIIFAGFLVYLIWGLVFDFVMKEYRERDKIKEAQRRVKRDIEVFEKRIEVYQNNINEMQKDVLNLNETIENLIGRINELQLRIDGIIIPTREYVLYASEYMQGWLTYIQERLVIADDVKNGLTAQCLQEYNSHLDLIGANSDTQNTIYSSAV